MVTVNKMKDYETTFKKALIGLLEKQGQEILIGLQEEVKKHLMKTLLFAVPRADRKNNGFGTAKILFSEKSLKKTNKGVVVTVRAFIADKNTGKPHEIWHYISQGTPDITLTKTIAFPVRKDNRTSVGKLESTPFTGYTGKWRRIEKGKTRRGIEARGYYKLAFDLIESNFFTKFPLWDFSKSRHSN